MASRHDTPTKHLDSIGVFTGRTVAAHCVWVNDGDMGVLKARNVGVAHCPSSNMKLASGVAPVVRMLALGINVGLGPDGPAGSNNDFNMFEEMDLAAKLAKVTSLNPTVLPARLRPWRWRPFAARVYWASKRRSGRWRSGSGPILITVRLDRANAVPVYDAISQMVYASKAGRMCET